MRHKALLIALLAGLGLPLLTTGSFAHPGPTDKDGCHEDPKEGYHCH